VSHASTVVGAVVGCWIVAYLVVRLVARWCDRQFEGASLAGVLRTVRRLGYAAVTALSLVGWRALNAEAVLASEVAGRVSGSALVVATTLALGTTWLGGVLAVALGAVPARRRAREFELSHRFVAQWLLSRGFGSLWLVSLAVAVVSFVPVGLPQLVAIVLVVAGVTLALPVTLAVGLRAREATATEAALVEDLLRSGVQLRVVDDRTRVGPAFAAGTRPGPRMVFVARAVFDVCDEDAIRAVVAHEVAHHRRGHVALRLGAVAAGVLPVLAALELGVSVPAWVPVLAPAYALVVAWTFRRTEFAADAAAARAVAPSALASAFDELARHRLLLVDPPGATRLFALHPTIAARKRRLRGGQ
jgi:STE24 endopeptidase